MITRAVIVLLILAGSAQETSVRDALGLAATPKVAQPPPPASSLVGTSDPRVAEREQAIASGDIARALAAGATASDIATMIRRVNPEGRIDPETAVFIRRDGKTVLASKAMNCPGFHTFADLPEFEHYSPPSGVDRLPTEDEALGPLLGGSCLRRNPLP